MATKQTNMIDPLPLTMSIADGGLHFLGLKRQASYAAARRGDLETIQIPALPWTHSTLTKNGGMILAEKMGAKVNAMPPLTSPR